MIRIIVLIDVSDPHEYNTSRIEGAVSIPLNTLEDRIDELETLKPYVIYCIVGVRSVQAVRLLKNFGFSQVRNLTGGLRQWNWELEMEVNAENRELAEKYRKTSQWYDFLDAYWERQYQKIRPHIIGELSGRVLEVGVGTGRNLSFYPPDVHLTAIDLSPEMLEIARTRKPEDLDLVFIQADATMLGNIPSNHFDWYVATFLYCVMPDHLQPRALDQMTRVLKPGGKFRILEIVYSKNTIAYLKQKLFAPFVRRVYGAEFNRNTLGYINDHPHLQITRKAFLKGDTLLLLEGEKVENKEPTIEDLMTQRIDLEALEKRMITSWGSKVAVFCTLIISLLKQGTITPQVALLSFEYFVPSPIEILSVLSSQQSFSSLLYTGISSAVGFFLPSGLAQELAGIRAGVNKQEQRATNPNQFFALKQAGKTALSAIVCESVGGFVAGPAGAVAGAVIGAYLGGR